MPSKPIVYKEKEYASQKELCREFGLNYHTFITRMRNGWSLEKTMEVGVGEIVTTGNPVEYEGKAYPSVKALAEEYGLPYSSLFHLYSRKQNIEAAVESCMKQLEKAVVVWGRPYKGVSNVALEFGLRRASLYGQWKKGVPLETAVRELLSQEPITFRGKTYAHFSDLCAQFRVQPANAYARLAYGMPLESALTQPVKKSGRGYPEEFDGKWYESRIQLCRAYGISDNCVREQTKKKALEYMDSFRLLIQLKELAGIPQTELLTYIPGCRIRGRNYKTVAALLAVFEITATAFYTYKSRHHYVNIFDALRGMQAERMKVYIFDGKQITGREVRQKFTDHELKEMRLNPIIVPRYPTLQTADFQTGCVDTLEIYEALLYDELHPKQGISMELR